MAEREGKLQLIRTVRRDFGILDATLTRIFSFRRLEWLGDKLIAS